MTIRFQIFKIPGPQNRSVNKKGNNCKNKKKKVTSSHKLNKINVEHNQVTLKCAVCLSATNTKRFKLTGKEKYKDKKYYFKASLLRRDAV